LSGCFRRLIEGPDPEAFAGRSGPIPGAIIKDLKADLAQELQ